MTRKIIDSRFMDTMSDYFPSLCTIQEDIGVADANGFIVPSWSDFAGHVDIPCAHGPSGGNEVKLPDQTYVISNYTLALQGLYPTITEKMRAVVDGVVYEILLAQSDSHSTKTRILSRKVT